MGNAVEKATDGHNAIWEDIANKLSQAVRDYKVFLDGMGSDSDNNWQGKTAESANKNIDSSFKQIDGASKSATAMVTLSPAFGEAIGNVVKEVVNRKDDYQDDWDSWPEHREEIKREYDALAQSVMKDFAFNIGQIATRNPDLTGGTTTPEHPGPTAPGQTSPNYGGPSGTGAGTPSKGSGAPDFSGLKNNTTKPNFDPTKQTTPQNTNTPSLPTDGLTDGLSDAANAAKDAASQGLDAAKQALDQALGNGQNPPALPEGVLGLGPKGLSNAAKGTAAGSGRGSSGPGPRTSPLARNAGTATPAATKGTGAPTTAARSGISAGSGSPGAGAPAAGHRGNGADGSVHKANKALRRKKNGEDVMGDAEAVVAVVGDDAQEPRMGVPATAEK
ncbi:hypothetical protein A5779_15585 [Mycolicibacterium peregrinum]|uniref:Uncharacterized protein n=2 Tax=Mycolicibacterium peregrinum TaxID=43304 RepID=A0A1A0WFU8_MYCPR|nr:hypothetical protein A5779_15585 [Mycolicibacterium peregrinum]